MKKIYFLAVLLLCSLIANAQYVLTIDDVEFDTSTGTITKYYDTGEWNIEIPETFSGVTVRAIGQEAFVIDDKKILLAVVMPNTVTTIGESAFYGNNNLQELNLTGSITTIGTQAFANTGFRSLTIPNSVVFIGMGAFAQSNLSSLKISNSITEIEDAVFMGNNLSKVTIPSSVEKIGNGAFAANYLTSIDIPNTVTSIGSFAFQFNSLTSVSLPNSLTSIEDRVFSDNKLTSITIPNSIQSIGERAFHNNSFTEVTIPNSVSFIGVRAFGHDTGNYLESIALPADVLGFKNEVWKNSIGQEVTAMTSSVWSYTVYGDAVDVHSVTFLDYDGSLIETVGVDHGSTVIPPEDPARTGYTFTGWDASLDNVTADYSVTAEYVVGHTVSFIDWDGTLLKKEAVVNGSAATAPTDPTRTGYTFTGWDISFNNVTSALTVTAQYQINSYVVVFRNWDGTVLKTENVEYGSSATAPSDPARTGYTFTGWDNDFKVITSALTVMAKYTINSYEVIFLNWDKTLLLKETVKYGDSATAPSDPTRPGYTFTGWDVDFGKVTSALTIIAEYNINSYGVVFLDWDGKELLSEKVKYGDAATAPVDPTRIGYTFIGWDTDFSVVSTALTVTAKYSINSYEVTFLDWDGGVLKTENVDYGSSATAPADPVRTGYTFTGWDVAFDNITTALTVTAQYTINSYTITFVDWDGGVLKTENVDYGSSATAPSDPTRTGYSFTGWDVAFDNITTALTVTAQYTINSYEVSFVDWDGEVLKTENVDYGSSATAPADPVRTGYSFTGWDETFDNITTALTVTAQYIINSYTVTFVDWHGGVLKTENVDYGSLATAPADPTRTGYSFTGWDVAFDNITTALTVTAQYTINNYEVSFVDWDGVVLKTENVDYGNLATAPADPTRTGYSFTGWDVAFDNITTALTVTAQYTINSYTVTFVDWDGGVLKTENVDYGSSSTAPADPVRACYIFTGWDVAFDNITTALTVTAQYTINSYEVSFVDWDGGVLKTENVDYGSSATAPSDPVRAGYSFTGWDVAFDNITTALTVTAQYTINSYEVSFVDWDGGVLKTESVDYGSSSTAPADPVRAGYSFTGWDVAFDNITTALTVTAQYTINSYEVSFVDWDGGVLKTENVNYGSSATAPSDPVRTGYTFVGWDVAFTNITSDLTVTARYDVVNSVDEVQKKSIKIYPNPAITQFTLEGAEGADLSIYDTTGKLIRQMPDIANKQLVLVNDLPKGIYFLKIGNEVHKVIVQ